MSTNNTDKYSLPLRVLHWLTAATIMTLLVVGFYMADIDPDAVDKYDLYPIHKAFGMIALLLVLLRLPVRAKGPIPPPMEGFKKWECQLSRLVHIGLYVAMLTMTWSGYLMNSTYAYVEGVDIFGLFSVPDITPKDEYWNGVAHQFHTITAWSFVVLLSLHLGGVAKHRLLDGREKDVLKRMI
jgi:cytochrome b561